MMVTDTAFLRNPHYHQASDRIETLAEYLCKYTQSSSPQYKDPLTSLKILLR